MSDEAINQINERLDEIYQETIDELQQETKQLKEVIEEVRKKLKLERKIALSLNQTYTVSVVDSTLHILDKVKEK